MIQPIHKGTLGLLAALCLQLASGNLAGETAAPGKQPEEGKPPAPEQARALIARARAYRDVESYESAQKEIITALERAPDDPSLREDGIKLWREIEQAKKAKSQTEKAGQERKNMAELDESRRLASEGKTAEAATKASQVLGATNDPKIMEEAQKILEENHPTFGGLFRVAWRDLFTALGWGLTILESFAVLAILYGLLWVARIIPTAFPGVKWRLGVIDDKTQSNVTAFVIASFARWEAEPPSASAGLLRLGTAPLPTVEFMAEPPNFDLSTALDSLKLQIGTVSVSGVAKVWAALRVWLNALRPSITGAAFIQGTEIVVHLIKRSANGNTAAVIARSITAEPGKAAEAASYKMYYLIAKQTTADDAELANKFRDGLAQLNQYISGADPKQLETAYQTFHGVVQEKPNHEEACLYEGVALDLLERHDEAISRFVYLAKNAVDPDLKKKAQYNEAISRFRRYTSGDSEIAIDKLDGLIENDSVDALAKSPINALAYAAKANAITNKFIFWKKDFHFDSTSDPAELEKKELQAREKIEETRREVEAMIHRLNEVYEKTNDKRSAKPGHWDALSRRQLRWATQNAKGNTYLNLAVYVYPPSHPDRPDNLKTAREAFEECEVLLPAGVETLTNLATTFINLDQGELARRYAQRAIDLNPNYEYAYYRLAQSWEKENRRDEVAGVLTKFPRKPGIPGFQAFFNRYYVVPKSA